MTLRDDTTNLKPPLRRLLQALIWGATFALLGWLLGLEPSWQLLLLVLACTFVGIVPALSVDAMTRWAERGVRLLIWGLVVIALCWLMSLQPTWQLAAVALACTLVDLVLHRWFPAPAATRSAPSRRHNESRR